MFKKAFLASLFLASSLFAGLSKQAVAAEWASPVSKIVLCSESWFELELAGRTMAYNGSQKLVRFMVKSSVVGAEKFKQIYSMSLTAFSTQAPLWVGTSESSTTTSASGGNCSANNVPSQTLTGIGIYR
jgi:hypothetical protein